MSRAASGNRTPDLALRGESGACCRPEGAEGPPRNPRIQSWLIDRLAAAGAATLAKAPSGLSSHPLLGPPDVVRLDGSGLRRQRVAGKGRQRVAVRFIRIFTAVRSAVRAFWPWLLFSRI